MLLVDRAHQCRRRGQDLVHKDEDGLFRGELDSFTDDVDELADSQVLFDDERSFLRENDENAADEAGGARTAFSGRKRRWYGGVERTHGGNEVLLLVDVRDVRLLHLLANDLVGVDDVTGCRTPRDRIKLCTVNTG